MEWCEHHQDDEEDSDESSSDEEEDKSKQIDNIPAWDKQFIAKLTRSDVYESMQACSYLDLRVIRKLNLADDVS